MNIKKIVTRKIKKKNSYIKKTYNSVKLREEDWCLQWYIWQKDLDPMKLHKEEVIEILIYGITSCRH